ncbi:hypothetical protein HK096_003062 [Nowakowskiella sp. JEL0078]|nr:hypothetical protein HK096_003062 [Nowakowskiella sp. JEL0078]
MVETKEAGHYEITQGMRRLAMRLVNPIRRLVLAILRPVLVMTNTSDHKQVRVFANQALFLMTGLISTLGAQALFYKDAQSMLTILATYIVKKIRQLIGRGMITIALIPQSGKGNVYAAVSNDDDDTELSDPLALPEPVLFADNIPHRALLLIAVLDVGATIVLTVGLFFVGSGVIYSSVIVFTALLSRAFLNRHLSVSQWVAVFTITAGLALNALEGGSGGDVHGSFGGSKNKKSSDVVAGFFISLTGTAIYASVYTLNDFVLSSTPNTKSVFLGGHKPPTPRQQCFWIGTYCTVLTLILQILYSLPHLSHMPLNDVGVLATYLVLVLSSLGHNVAYFELVESTGAVATGILQALRAVLVFALSHWLFCASDNAQCYTTTKGIATIVVVSGVLAFAFAKARAKNTGKQIELVEFGNDVVFDVEENNKWMDRVTQSSHLLAHPYKPEASPYLAHMENFEAKRQRERERSTTAQHTSLSTWYPPPLPLPLSPQAMEQQPPLPTDLQRNVSKMSKRSYVSNLSMANRNNLARFGGSKITLLVFNMIVSLAVFLLCVFTWADNYTYAPIIKLYRIDVLILNTTFSGVMIIVGFVGFVGALTHSKATLTIFNVLLWVVLVGIVVSGYLTYKDVNSGDWEGMLTNKWGGFVDGQRKVVQETYGCCGFYSSLDRPWVGGQCGVLQSEIVVKRGMDKRETRENQGDIGGDTNNGMGEGGKQTANNRETLFARNTRDAQQKRQAPEIEGCRGSFGSFSGLWLRLNYITAFSLVPVILLVFVIAILAANHIYD